MGRFRGSGAAPWCASVVTSKPAIEGHQKSGQRKDDFLCLGAQLVLADLAGGGARQRAELDVLGTLEVRQALAAPGDQLFGGGGVVGLQADESFRHFPHFSSGTVTMATSATAG